MKEKVFIKNIKIEYLFRDVLIDWAIPENQNTTILVGDNGVGKTTILQLIRDIMTGSDFVKRNLYRTLRVWTNKDYYSLSFPPLDYIEMINYYTQIGGFESAEIDAKINVNIDESQMKIFRQSLKKALNEMESIRSIFKDMKKDGLIDGHKSSGDDLEFLYLADRTKSKYLQSHPRMAITYISTVDLLANLSREFNNSAGQKTNYFDEEVKIAFEQFLLNGSQEDIYLFKESLNVFFGEISKEVVITDNEIGFLNKRGDTLTIKDLSSGERQITYILIKVALAKVLKHDLILMDEPEISLHLNWQSKLLEEVRKINDYSQIIVATHSPALVMKGWRDSYVDIREISFKHE